MLEKVEELKQGFLEQGLPEVNVGIGLNTGFMNVGDMGSTYRRSYTVLGDAVNLGSRLESLTKFYGIRLLVGQETVKDLDGFLFRLIDRVKVKVKGKVKGKEEAIDCYQPLCEKVAADNELRSRVESYHQALACYHSQDWDGAQEKFTTLLQQEPETLLYQIYLDRVATLRDASLPSH